MLRRRFNTIEHDTIIGGALGATAGMVIALSGGLEGLEAPVHYLVENVLGIAHPTFDEIIQVLSHSENPGVAPAYPGALLGVLEGATLGLAVGIARSIRERLGALKKG